MEERGNKRGGKGGAWVICLGELVPVDGAGVGILFKWVTEAAEADIYQTWQHSVVYCCV